MTGTITSLVTQKRNKSRVNVFLDGEFVFGLAAIHAVPLRKGQQLTEEDIKQLKHKDLLEVAYERALNFLSYRPRSEWEVQRKLKSAISDIQEEQLEQVLERLRRAGLLDDAEFANYWVSNRDQFKPRGKRALRYELRQKGIGEAQIEPALETIDEDDAAMRAAQTRASRFAGLSRNMFYKRLGDFLSRRGFNYDVSREIIEKFWVELGTEEDIPDHI